MNSFRPMNDELDLGRGWERWGNVVGKGRPGGGILGTGIGMVLIGGLRAVGVGWKTVPVGETLWGKAAIWGGGIVGGSEKKMEGKGAM